MQPDLELGSSLALREIAGLEQEACRKFGDL